MLSKLLTSAPPADINGFSAGNADSAALRWRLAQKRPLTSNQMLSKLRVLKS